MTSGQGFAWGLLAGAAAMSVLYSGKCHAGPFTLSWGQVTQYTNGATILEPVTYTIYQGKKGQAKPLLIDGIYGTSYAGSATGGRRLCWNVRTKVVGHPLSNLSNEVCKWISK